MEDEVYSCHNDDVSAVITHFCDQMQSNPLEVVTLVEAIGLFDSVFPVEDDQRHYMTDGEMCKFLRTLNEIAIDRTLSKLVEDGLVDYGHNGEEFVFSLTEKGKQYPL